MTVDPHVADPDLPAVQRLIDRTAEPWLADPTVRAVEVRDADGRVLGVRHPRPVAEPASGASPVNADPDEPPAAATPADPVAASRALGPVPASPRRALPARLDLPPGVTELLDDDPTVAELLEAVLGATGTAHTHRDGALVVGDVALVPIEAAGVVTDAQLNQAYLRFTASGARDGVALTAGQLPHHELRRRHALAPRLRHGGADALQRLADDVALHGDLAATLRELADANRPVRTR